MGLLRTDEQISMTPLGHQPCPLHARALQEVGWRARDLAPWNCPCLVFAVVLEAQLLAQSVMALSLTASTLAQSLHLEPAPGCAWNSQAESDC